MTDYQAGPEGGEYLYPGSGDPAPRVGAKVQLLTIGGVHTNGPWRDDGSCLGWLPLPKRNMEKEDMTDKITIERETLERAVTALECSLSDSRPYIVRSRESAAALRAALAAQPASGAVCTMTDVPCTRNCGLACSLQMEALAAQPAEPEYWQWRRKSERWEINQIYRHEVYATTDDSEVRKLYAAPPAPAAAAVAKEREKIMAELRQALQDDSNSAAIRRGD